jgi:hypothetical protein
MYNNSFIYLHGIYIYIYIYIHIYTYIYCIFIIHPGASYLGNAPRPNQPTRPPPVPRQLTSSVHGPPFANPHSPTHTPRPSSSSYRRCALAASVRASAVGRPMATRNPSCGARRNPRLGDFDAHPSPRLRAGDHISIHSPNPRFNFLLTVSPSDSRAAAGPLMHSDAGS